MRRTKQRAEPAASKKMNTAASSSDGEDSDVERNFALLTERGGGEEREEEEEQEEEMSDGGEEEEEGGAEAGDDESDASEEEEEEEVDEEPAEQAAGGSSEVRTEDDIKKELSTMSFEEIMQLQNKVGTKVYGRVAHGSRTQVDSSKKKRLNKNRPMEMSSKKPAPFLRQVVPVKKSALRDPRFDDLSGEYKPEIFEKTHKFIDEIKLREKEIIMKKLKKMKKMKKNNQRKEKLEFLLKRMENQERARASRAQQRERELQFKRQQREQANQGARPFFLKNSEKKKLLLAEKYQDLKKSGKLDNFLSKKRKRNAGKDRRKLPKQLQNQETV